MREEKRRTSWPRRSPLSGTSRPFIGKYLQISVNIAKYLPQPQGNWRKLKTSPADCLFLHRRFTKATLQRWIIPSPLPMWGNTMSLSVQFSILMSLSYMTELWPSTAPSVKIILKSHSRHPFQRFYSYFCYLKASWESSSWSEQIFSSMARKREIRNSMVELLIWLQQGCPHHEAVLQSDSEQDDGKGRCRQGASGSHFAGIAGFCRKPCRAAYPDDDGGLGEAYRRAAIYEWFLKIFVQNRNMAESIRWQSYLLK